MVILLIKHTVVGFKMHSIISITLGTIYFNISKDIKTDLID